MSIWNILRVGASGLNAQRLRLDLISNNIANVETTRTKQGGPYQRQEVVFRAENANKFVPASLTNHSSPVVSRMMQQGGVEVAAIIEDQQAGQRVYDPKHPDADEDGYVTYPNVNLVVEMTNMLSATRSYEANLTIIDMAKRMAMKALDIGR